MRVVRLLVLAAAMVTMGAGGVAAAQPAPGARLLLTVADGESPTPVQRAALLRCEPAGGSHPTPAAACRDLNLAGGDPRLLPGDPDEQNCPKIYEPVTVTALGYWHNRPVAFQRTYANSCVLFAETGPVYRF